MKLYQPLTNRGYWDIKMVKILLSMLELSLLKTRMTPTLSLENLTSRGVLWLLHLVILEGLACMLQAMDKVKWRTKQSLSPTYSLECIILSTLKSKIKPPQNKKSSPQLEEQQLKIPHKCNKLSLSPISWKQPTFMPSLIEKLIFLRIDCTPKPVSINTDWIKIKIIMKN